MSYATYDSYKDSGVDWLGEIPSDWELEKAKWLFKKMERPVSPNDEIVTCFRDGQVTLRSNRRTEGFTNALKEHGYQGIRKGDLVIHQMDAFAGAIGISDSDGKSTPVYSACVPFDKNRVESKYYSYFLRNLAYLGFIESLAKGIRERSTDFRFSDFAKLILPVPAISEQREIVDFIDKNLAQIDQAIALKQQQIEKLGEYKQIVIQNAVTKGLNPNVPMKDSGVEWIGDIPEHWQMKRLKYVLDERNERSKTGEEPLFMVSQKYGLVVRADYHEKAEVAQSNIDNKIVYKNDLVFNKLKPHLGVFYKSEIDFKGLVSPDYAVYKVKNYIYDMKYLEILFRNPKYIEQFIIRATGIVEGLIRLYTTSLFELPVMIPPKEEQETILNFVKNENDKIDISQQNLEKQIDRLKEYKNILINQAVTGKIKI
nr:restriction endonuclease subunit S [Moraxella sp. CTOTU48717]